MNITYVEAILDKLVTSLQHAAQKIDHLEACGYSHTFRRAGNNLLCVQTKREYAPTDLKIEEFHEVRIDNHNTYYIFALSKPGSLLRGILTECPPPDTDEVVPE